MRKSFVLAIIAALSISLGCEHTSNMLNPVYEQNHDTVTAQVRSANYHAVSTVDMVYVERLGGTTHPISPADFRTELEGSTGFGTALALHEYAEGQALLAIGDSGDDTTRRDGGAVHIFHISHKLGLGTEKILYKTKILPQRSHTIGFGMFVKFSYTSGEWWLGIRSGHGESISMRIDRFLSPTTTERSDIATIIINEIIRTHNLNDLPNPVSLFEIRPGNGAKAPDSSTVNVGYRGIYIDQQGEKVLFDENIDPSIPFTFTLNSGEVIPGFEIGVSGMRKGGVRLVVIKPEMGYGDHRIGSIPPNTTLIFIIELYKAQ